MKQDFSIGNESSFGNQREKNKGAVSYIGVAVMLHNLNFSFLRHKYDRVTELAGTFLLASCLDAFQKLLSLCNVKVSRENYEETISHCVHGLPIFVKKSNRLKFGPVCIY